MQAHGIKNYDLYSNMLERKDLIKEKKKNISSLSEARNVETQHDDDQSSLQENKSKFDNEVKNEQANLNVSESHKVQVNSEIKQPESRVQSGDSKTGTIYRYTSVT